MHIGKLQNSLICYRVLKYVLNYEVMLPKRADTFFVVVVVLFFIIAILNLDLHNESLSIMGCLLNVHEHEEIAPGDPNQSFHKMYSVHREVQRRQAVALQDLRG